MERRHLVYVLPGIGGSVLERPGSGGRPDRTVWDTGYGDIAGLVAAPGRLAPDEPLRAVGAVRSRSLLPGWTVVPGYDRLIAALGALPGLRRVDHGHPDRRDLDADLVVFPYDFRLGVTEAAGRLAADVRERLAHLGGGTEGRVIVVAHSMGGLVARYWLGPLGGWPSCRALITAGTPHRGAPKALQIMANGVRVAGLRLGGLSGVLTSWRSVAELLPQYPAVWDADAGTARRPHELPVDWAGAATRAAAVHGEIQQAWSGIPRGGPQVVPRIGWSHRTPSSARWTGGRLKVGRDRPHWLTLPGWEHDDGDGTVPAVSAVPGEMDGYDVSGWLERERHGFLANGSWIPALVRSLLDRAPLAPVHGRERQWALGLDLEELHLPGRPIPLRVRLREYPAVRAPLTGPPMPAVWATVRRAGGDHAALADVRLEPDASSGEFAAELAALEPGLYDVLVRARAVPGAGDLAVAETVAVVAP
ncbi:hypothetical protein AB0O05_18540 [Streptomyces sp. NPDC093084]|uniref:esterase/lipase family protein n=1 Tax=Streptomyces sp. NPDC093084 TaxID=3155197 RepID=UPI003435E310